ncbi:MAG: hypothetical protein A3K77_06575 [Euryarchaeota archaeon RBG_13_31_8]|nr:MAG: hypothetical protein A3K77_06575 [Euryarchaeota archaeon RBG_13_31_8]
MVKIKINKYGRARDYKKILNKNDPFDKIILNMIKNNELSVSIVDINQPNYDTIYTLNLNSQSKSKLDKIPIYPT